MTDRTEEPTHQPSGFSSDEEAERRAAFREQFQRSPLPAHEQLQNLGLFMNRQSLSRVLAMHELYGRALEVPGSIMEFGVRWGQNLALMMNLRGIYEPFNYTRRIIGFDTFSGFPSVHDLDGTASAVAVGGYGVSEDYELYLDRLLDYHEHESPIAHLRKYELVKGDVTVTVPEYLEAHPETVVALAYFDLDLYEPTRACLAALGPHLTRGSVLAFDEINHPDFPGETAAVKELLGLDRVSLRRSQLSGYAAYLIVE